MTKATSPGLDAILGQEIKVLDKGFVRVVDYMGNDSAIVQAARVSYGAGTKHVSEDRGLIRYLMRHWHSTPFEMCEIKLHVKLPVFVARQWIRHRTANVNEYSARYSILDREFYIPEVDQIATQSKTNNQGRGEAFDEADALNIRELFKDHSDISYNLYENQIEDGLARELARMHLPTNIYTQWYWKVDLHNLFHFLRLRADPHAQYEIRVYAEAICEIVKQWVPHAWEAFEDYRLLGAQFSRMELDALKILLDDNINHIGTDEVLAGVGLSKREQTEFLQKIGAAA
ncbi:MAG: FAD-dependent thymidylate synthase [Rhodobacterales bacterium]|mgnify:CR=1 FL=1|nr:FAD-dependent thymidylate synthase [Rhodobacterales bacterium]